MRFAVSLRQLSHLFLFKSIRMLISKNEKSGELFNAGIIRNLKNAVFFS